LRFFLDGGTPLPAADAAWLKAYEAAEVKRTAKKARVSTQAVAKAETKAKKEGRTLTMADLREAAAPKTPSTKGRVADPDRVQDRAGVLAVAIQNHEVETLAMATALAFGSLPRTGGNREVRRMARMGLTLWVVVTYAPKRKRGGGIMFGSDAIALIALTEMARQGAERLEFDSMAALLTALDAGKTGRQGGKQKELAFDRLRRVRNTAITIAFYSSEADAKAETNEIRLLDVTVIHDYWNPMREEARGEQPLFKPWLEISPAFAKHTQEPKALTYLPTTMVHSFVGHPLKLQFAMWLYPRCMAAKSMTRVPMSELQDQFGEGREARWLIRDLQVALGEIQDFYKAAGRTLHARFVPGTEGKTGPKGGRPAKTWDLELGPSDKLTGAKGPKALKG
jgi:hypothetical protein